MRTLAMPETAEPWSLTSLREKLIKIGAKVVSHGRYVLPAGRDRGAAADVCGHSVADRPAASGSRASMRNAGSKCSIQRRQRCASMNAEQLVSARQCSPPAGLRPCCARGARCTVAQDARRGDHGSQSTTEFGECRFK
jgi:hypothetical protein